MVALLAIETENRSRTVSSLNNDPAPNGRSHDVEQALHFFARTSWGIALSSDRSATSRFSSWFSSSNCCILRSSDGASPPCSCFQQ
jgi:hypothetical protein